jgi:protein-tyrosine-phosphatase
MAEGIAQKWLDNNGFNDWLAVSAGVFANEGNKTSEETVEALSQRGIVFDGTSLPLTEEMAKSAKAVLCMSLSHLFAVSQFTNKAELLDPSGDILDPIGQDQSTYDALAEQMEQLIATKLQLLTSEGA